MLQEESASSLMSISVAASFCLAFAIISLSVKRCQNLPPTTTPPSYDVRLARIHSFATSYTTELDPTYMAEEPDFDAKGMIKPVLTAGTTTAIAPGGGVEYADEAEIYGSTGSLLAAENGVIWEVIGNTCTGYYQIGGTASFAAVDDPEVTQIHHGDIHVDGRWS